MPLISLGYVWCGVSRQKPKRISKIQKNLVFGWRAASKGQLTRDMCTVDIVFFWSHILRIVHQVLLWSVSQLILGNFTCATVPTFNCSKHLGLKFERAIPGRVRVLFSNFVKWQPSIKWFSKIWLHTRYESRKKNLNPSIILATYWNL
jgi:hypothetical protein